MRRALAAVVAGLLVTSVTAAVLVVRGARVEGDKLAARAAELDPAGRRAEWERELDARRGPLRDDRARLGALEPLFSSSGSRGDAGPVLNAMLEWPAPWPGRPRPALHLPPEVVDRLVGWGEGDLHRLAEIDFATIDLTWMSQLSQFDHWDLERHSPWDEVSADEEAADWFRDREPHLEGLTPWVKLRLMKGLESGEPWDALGETRQLVRLLLSTETLLASVEAMVLLHLEREAYVAALASRPDKVSGWPVVGNAETAPAAIRYWRALPALLGLASPATDFDDAARERSPGLCAALREASRSALALRPLLDEARASGYRRLEVVLAAMPECRLTRVRAAFAASSLSARWRALGRIGEDARPLPDDMPDAPMLRRLALLLSSPLRAAVGEPLLLDANIAALQGGR